MPHKQKRDLQLERLLQYFAEFGFKQIDNISHLTKAIGISRSLFYFYFKDTDDLLRQLATYHQGLVLKEQSNIISESLTHLQYLKKLVECKDLYFFTIQCKRHKQEHPIINDMYHFVLETLDKENFKLFVKHYQLEDFSSYSIKLLYDTFRGFWYDHSDYHSWGEERAHDLAHQVHSMMILLRSHHVPSKMQQD